MWFCPSRFFFFNDTATTEIYTLSLHDALPIQLTAGAPTPLGGVLITAVRIDGSLVGSFARSEEHTSELQSHSDLVCRLLLEKKKKINLEKDETTTKITTTTKK